MPPERINRAAIFLALLSCGCQSEGSSNQPESSSDASSEPASHGGTTSDEASSATSSRPTTTTGTSSVAVTTTTASNHPSTSTATNTSSTSREATQESSDVDTSAHESNATNSENSGSEVTIGSSADTTSSPSNDPCATTLLCDDFDDRTAGMPPSDPWTVETNGGSIEISTERAFSGDKSVHVSNTQGAYKRAFFSVDGAPLFPAAGSEMFGRMMMWLEATPAGSVHWTFIQGEGPSDDGSYDIFYRYGGQHEGKLMANFETQGKATDCWDHSATVMPTQTWACLEWRFNVATDEMQFWLDGDEVADIHAIGMGEGCGSQDLAGAWPAPAQFEVLRLGWEKYQESAELNAWIDDVAVGTSRVGCPED